jgi:Zn-dependent protease
MLLAFMAFSLDRFLSPVPAGGLATFLYYLAQINIILASFNLIPIPPLDGSKILMGFLPERWQYSLARLEPYGFFVIIGLLYVGALNPVIDFFRWIVLTLISILLP